MKTKGAQHNSFNKSSTYKTFFQIVPVIISNGNRFIRTNALLDTGSDTTLLKPEFATKLGLRGRTKRLIVTNALLKTTELDSKLVSFEISSASHPDKIKIQNAWVISDLDTNYQNFDIENLKLSNKHLKGINIPPLNPGAVSLIIETDFPELQIHLDFRSGEPHQPCAVKTKLSWILMGGKTSSLSLTSNSINTSFGLETFWSLENYGTVRKNDLIMLTKEEKRVVSILEDITALKAGQYEIGLLWKEAKPNLPYNRQLAVQGLQNLERKLVRNPVLTEKYKNTIQEYLDRVYAQKLTTDQATNCNGITNYILIIVSPVKANLTIYVLYLVQVRSTTTLV